VAFVRLQIEAALARNVRVVPILVDDATMPHAEELTHSLVRLARRQAAPAPLRLRYRPAALKVLDRTLAGVRTVQRRQHPHRRRQERRQSPALRKAPEQPEPGEPATPSRLPANFHHAHGSAARDQSKPPDPSTLP
jgi:hypothetical protein